MILKNQITNFIIESVFLLCLTILLVFDYFPQKTLISIIPFGAIKWIIIAVFLISMIFNQNKSSNAKESFKRSLFLLSYFILLIGLLNILGGKSSVGISFDSFYFWIVVIIAVWEMRQQYKKMGHSSLIKFNIVALIPIIVIFSFNYWNDYRERNLTELIRYNPQDFLSIRFTNNITSDHLSEWWTKDREATDELIEYLSQFRVKRVKENEFAKLDTHKMFEFTITHVHSNPAIVYAKENFIHILVGDYYQVLNGPIDMEWIDKYNDKYRDKNVE
ncbi:hypothetical protein ACQKP0_01875 [Heyndrickxia sp. NPDC080065]|uniref:hypothetical protein n=1 Tax=Heyndrickxia sp. NPDC080065 TaxID=3390568 RepID=UPI003D01493A